MLSWRQLFPLATVPVFALQVRRQLVRYEYSRTVPGVVFACAGEADFVVGRDLIVVGRVWIGRGYVVYTLWVGHFHQCTPVRAGAWFVEYRTLQMVQNCTSTRTVPGVVFACAGGADFVVGRDLIVVGRVWIGRGYVVYTLWVGHFHQCTPVRAGAWFVEYRTVLCKWYSTVRARYQAWCLHVLAELISWWVGI